MSSFFSFFCHLFLVYFLFNQSMDKEEFWLLRTIWGGKKWVDDAKGLHGGYLKSTYLTMECGLNLKPSSRRARTRIRLEYFIEGVARQSTL